MKGYIQVYTGNGKGKTTAAIGLAIRAAGAGLTVFIGQFLKQGDYSEIKALSKFENITVKQFGMGKFVRGNPSDEERLAAEKGYGQMKTLLKKGSYDVVIIEEGNVAVSCGLISEEDLLSLMALKPNHVELIITGRGAAEAVMDRADLVTEMVEIKHYYSSGVMARVGIEK